MDLYSPCFISDSEMVSSLTFTMLRTNSTDNSLMIFFFQKSGFDISYNLHEMSNPVFWDKSEIYLKMLSVDFFLRPCNWHV